MTESPSAEGTSKGRPAWQQLLAALLILPLGCLSLFAVVKAPIYSLWKPAIGATEWGYLLALILLLLVPLCDRQTWLGRSLIGFALLGSILTLTPTVRALWIEQEVIKGVSQAFGAKARSPLGADGQHTPFALGRYLARTSLSKVNRKVWEVPLAKGITKPLALYRGKGTKTPRPLLVIIHGGSWRGGDYTQLSAINRYLAARGVHVASISYRLSPQATFPTHLQDVKTMIQWLRKRAKRFTIDPQNIAVAGRSAGGHLALLAAYKHITPGIRGVISFYAPTDLHWSWAHPANPWVLNTPKTLKGFLGGPPSQQKARYDDASPIQHVNDKTPPTLLVHGTRDELVSIQHAHRLAALLKRHKIKHYLLELPWATHACEAHLFGPSGQASLYAIERFLDAIWKRPRKTKDAAK